ncbi:MAG: 4-alpha-glucanotransferase [Oscillospiraceae bacterium]|nr:4-alpha-glucanotransferase [Oscillospiraceae bacterium]
MERESGILLHISSLPGAYGIGTLGQAAYRFVDFLKAAGQRYWQILPLGPTGFGDSPYQSSSIYAGNPYFIDPDSLLQAGLLEAPELQELQAAPGRVDYDALWRQRPALLERAYRRGKCSHAAPFEAFRRENPWVEDYALFLALKGRYGMQPWFLWSEELANRKPEALARAREELQEEISCAAFTQYFFDVQWKRLSAYARQQGVRIIGDIPIYVPLDSVDVWLHPELFQLDAARRPVAVAGCPPDGFTEDGQLWGNPLYDWERHFQSGFAWWIERVRAAARCFDLLRIDHFRGLESYWAVPYGEATARNGRWQKGPGLALIEALRQAVPELEFIAEDLGFLTPEVEQLLADSGLPGMKVLEFAFYGEDSAYLPHNHTVNSICYTGTHDNQTLAQWLAEESEESIRRAADYLGLNEAEGFARGMLRGGLSSVSRIFIAQMQDWLELGGEARMNTPGSLGPQNWSWRLRELPDAALAAEILNLTKRYGRTGNRNHA